MKEKKVYCTNIDDDDPIIEKFLKEYLDEKEDNIEDNIEVDKSDDLVVNFDITYGDGESENYICNNESEVFGERVEEKNEKKKQDEKEPTNENYSYYAENIEGYDIENEIGKWTNCVDEWCESSSKKKEVEYHEDKDCKCEVEQKVEEINKGNGTITVYSLLALNETTTLKGVTVNLYRINGVKPELVCSKETDEKGMAVFNDVEEGNYRIIQIIDKRYFEKPTYLTWNEVNISKANTEYVLYVLNTLKTI